ncbi:MAG: serine--tRNA ligase [Planctomycetota bacterium]|jgi:seryl-tRNA synthetase
MIDIKLIRDNPQKFIDGAKVKKVSIDIDRLLEVDAKLLENKQKLQDIATEKNRVGKEIPNLDPEKKKEALAALSQLKQDEADFNEAIKNLRPEFDTLMGQVAQPADPEVPVGEDDTENAELRKWGTIREFDFEPKDHVELGLALDIIDIERGVKLAGTRNYFLKGQGALLHWAVLRFSLDYMIGKGYTPMSVPLLMRDEVMFR